METLKHFPKNLPFSLFSMRHRAILRAGPLPPGSRISTNPKGGYPPPPLLFFLSRGGRGVPWVGGRVATPPSVRGVGIPPRLICEKEGKEKNSGDISTRSDAITAAQKRTLLIFEVGEGTPPPPSSFFWAGGGGGWVPQQEGWGTPLSDNSPDPWLKG